MISLLTISALVLVALLLWQVVDVIRLGSWQALREANAEKFTQEAYALHRRLSGDAPDFAALSWQERQRVVK
jgi:hypothetical protein